MVTIISLLNRLATWRGFTVLIVLYAIVFGGIITAMSRLAAITGGTGILDFDRGYTVERVREVFDSYGEEGFALYSRIQLLDLLNPAIYSLLFACIIYLLWQGRPRVWVVLFPLAGGILDYAENLTLYLLSSSYPELPLQLVSISSTLSLIKNAALFAAIAVFLIGLALWLRNRLKGAKN